MKKYLTVVVLTCLAITSVVCQINIDSLKIELDKSFIKQKGVNNWNAYTMNYMNKDSLVCYIISFDKKDQIEESIWGIVLTELKYDDRKRTIERRYYDRNGKLHFSDWPPVIKIFYDDKNRIIRKDYYGETEKPVKGFARLEFEYNEDGEVIEERMYDGEYELDGDRAITRFEYQDSNRVIITSKYNQNSELILNEGMAYRRDRYQSRLRENLLETRFLDKDNRLVLIEDRFTKIKYAVVKYTYNENGRGVKMQSYDTEMNLVNESLKYLPPKKR